MIWRCQLRLHDLCWSLWLNIFCGSLGLKSHRLQRFLFFWLFFFLVSVEMETSFNLKRRRDSGDLDKEGEKKQCKNIPSPQVFADFCFSFLTVSGLLLLLLLSHQVLLL